MIQFLDPDQFVNQRPGEKKLGQDMVWLNQAWTQSLEVNTIKYILILVSEDFGPRANLGNGGAHNFAEAVLQKFSNMQSNQFANAKELAILGKVDFQNNFIEKGHKPFTTEELREIVAKMDEQLSRILVPIIKAGKIPVLVGGGHNNAYPLMKSAALANEQAIQVLNFDAHADYRNTKEGRHSGNSFSLAAEQGFINHYAVVGLHRNYNSDEMLKRMLEHNVAQLFLEDIEPSTNRSSFIKHWVDVKLHSQYSLGLELDLDGIAGLQSSAKSPEGFTLGEVRNLVTYLVNKRRISYFNLTEGIADPEGQTAKAAAYLLADFINAKPNELN